MAKSVTTIALMRKKKKKTTRCLFANGFVVDSKPATLINTLSYFVFHSLSLPVISLSVREKRPLNLASDLSCGSRGSSEPEGGENATKGGVASEGGVRC